MQDKNYVCGLLDEKELKPMELGRYRIDRCLERVIQAYERCVETTANCKDIAEKVTKMCK